MCIYTLRKDSSLHCLSSSQAAIQLYIDSSTLVEMKIHTGVSCYFWECNGKPLPKVWLVLLDSLQYADLNQTRNSLWLLFCVNGFIIQKSCRIQITSLCNVIESTWSGGDQLLSHHTWCKGVCIKYGRGRGLKIWAKFTLYILWPPLKRWLGISRSPSI